MKRSHLATGLVVLAITGLWYFAGGAQPLPAAGAAESPRVAAPLTHENLTVYFVYGPDAMPDAKVLSLQEALERNLAVVHETSNVNTLAVENLSPEYELFVQSNDIVKGGKQDRVVQADVLLPPKSGVVALPVHCVEQGRWTGRGSEDAKRFASSYACVAGKELKYANATGQQAAVWQQVKENQDKASASVGARVNNDASPTSFQLTLESPELQAKVAAYEAALKAAGEDREGVVGVVFVVNGQVTGAEVYGSTALFRKAWPKLLTAAAVEAVWERTDKPAAAPPTAREVERYLAYGATGESGAPPTEASDLPSAAPYDRAAGRRSDRATFFLEGLAETDRTAQGEGRGQQTGGQPALPPPERAVVISGRNVDTNALAAPGIPGAGLGRGGIRTGSAGSQPAGQAGNRLSSNRAENASTLVVESRDLGRANAVIHRSYTPAPAAQPAAARPAPPAQPAAPPLPARP